MAKRKRRRRYTPKSALAEKKLIALEMTERTGIPHEVHHRHPRSRRRTYEGGSINEERNLSVVPSMKHRHWHGITNGNQLPKEWIKEVNETYMPPDWYLVAVPRHKPPRQGRRCRRYCKDCECVVLQKVPLKRDGK